MRGAIKGSLYGRPWSLNKERRWRGDDEAFFTPAEKVISPWRSSSVSVDTLRVNKEKKGGFHESNTRDNRCGFLFAGPVRRGSSIGSDELDG